MAKIKHQQSQIKHGVRGPGSGQNTVINMLRKGVITGLHEPIKVKRPGQYKASKADG